MSQVGTVVHLQKYYSSLAQGPTDFDHVRMDKDQVYKEGFFV